MEREGNPQTDPRNAARGPHTKDGAFHRCPRTTNMNHGTNCMSQTTDRNIKPWNFNKEAESNTMTLSETKSSQR